MAKKLRLYLDTSVLNFYYADDSPEKRDITIRFFEQIEKEVYFAYISDVVLDEIHKAPEQKRLKLLSLIRKFNLNELKTTSETRVLANLYVKHKIIPEKFLADALHIAIAVLNDMNVIISWNMNHIVKVKTRLGVNGINKMEGYKEIEIGTPEEAI